MNGGNSVNWPFTAKHEIRDPARVFEDMTTDLQAPTASADGLGTASSGAA